LDNDLFFSVPSSKQCLADQRLPTPAIKHVPQSPVREELLPSRTETNYSQSFSNAQNHPSHNATLQQMSCVNFTCTKHWL